MKYVVCCPLFFSTCGHDTFENSSVNCSVYYNSSLFTQTIQSDAIMLLDTLSKVTNGSYCIEMLNRFLCYLIFPPCDQSSNIEMIDPESCENYVVTGICAIHVDTMIKVLQNNDMDEVVDDLRNCNSPLLQPNDTASSTLISLPSNILATAKFGYYVARNFKLRVYIVKKQ